MTLTINHKPQEISDFHCTMEITISVGDVIDIVKRHDRVEGLLGNATFNKVAAVRELRDEFCYGRAGGEAKPRCISLRDAKQMVEAVMLQLGIPAQLG